MTTPLRIEAKGIGPNRWSDWKHPQVWAEEEVPEVLGVYELRYIDDHGQPVQWPAPAAPVPGFAEKCEGYQGVAYIGKAVNLRQRFFGMLCRSWIEDCHSLHDSKESWDEKDAAYQQAYPPERVECRFQVLGTAEWKPAEQAKMKFDISIEDVQFEVSYEELKRLYPSWVQGHGNSAKDPTVAHGLNTEQSLLCKFYRCFAKFPDLNRKLPKSCDSRELRSRDKRKLSGEFLDEQFAKMAVAGTSTDEVVLGDHPLPSASHPIASFQTLSQDKLHEKLNRQAEALVGSLDFPLTEFPELNAEQKAHLVNLITQNLIDVDSAAKQRTATAIGQVTQSQDLVNLVMRS